MKYVDRVITSADMSDSVKVTVFLPTRTGARASLGVPRRLSRGWSSSERSSYLTALTTKPRDRKETWH